MDYFLKWAIPGIYFFYFGLFNKVDIELNLSKTGFEPRITGVRSNHSTNWAANNMDLDLPLTLWSGYDKAEVYYGCSDSISIRSDR